MKFYTVGAMHITDRAWIDDYVANVTKLVEARGRPYRKSRTDGARTEMLMVPGEDVTGAARMS